MHVIYGRQHQTSFVHEQRYLQSDLQVVIHVGHTSDAKANLKITCCIYAMFVLSATHRMKLILTTTWMQNRKLNNFELILMQVLYLVEVLLMTFSLLTFGNSQQVNDCHPVFLRNTYYGEPPLKWTPLMAGCPYLRGFLYISGRHGMCNSADIATFSELYLTVCWQRRLTKGYTMSNTTNLMSSF